jgi:hypothetical protein
LYTASTAAPSTSTAQKSQARTEKSKKPFFAFYPNYGEGPDWKRLWLDNVFSP